jgi:hypothetical protein
MFAVPRGDEIIFYLQSNILFLLNKKLNHKQKCPFVVILFTLSMVFNVFITIFFEKTANKVIFDAAMDLLVAMT